MNDEIQDRFFERACRDLGMALIVADDALNVRFSNGAAEQLFGKPADALRGQFVPDLVPASRRQLVERLLRRVLDRGQVREFEYRHRMPDGGDAYLAVTLSPLRDDAGAGIGVSVCARDVTRGMDVVREVAEAQRMSALSLMAGAVAHHFNNLLGGVITTLDFAQASTNPEMLRRALRTTSSALARANGVTRSLLAFAEGSRSDTPTAGATDTVREFVADHAAAWAEHGIAVETDLDSIDEQVPVKPVLNVLEALTSNACESMLDGGTMRIALKPGPAGGVTLSVADTGEGIPAENTRRVFEPFFTTKHTQDPNVPDHVGLGLPVVHGIVKALGGKVTLESKIGAGTICVINLPFIS
jgi:PAS domain S-box-containing protein